MWIEFDPTDSYGIIPRGESLEEIARFEAGMEQDQRLSEQMARAGISSNAEVFGEAVLPTESAVGRLALTDRLSNPNS